MEIICPKCSGKNIKKCVPGMWPDEWIRNIKELLGKERHAICQDCKIIFNTKSGEIIEKTPLNF